MTFPTFSLIKKITVPVTRYTTGGYDAVTGIWQEGAENLFNIEANVQPLPGDRLIELPEARRDSEAIQLFTTTRLRTVNETGGTQADKFVYDGKTYEVVLVESFKMGVQDHDRVVAVKVDE